MPKPQTTLPDSSDLLNMIDDDDLRSLYEKLGRHLPYGNHAEQDGAKRLIIVINEKLKLWGKERNDSFGDRHRGEFACPKR